MQLLNFWTLNAVLTALLISGVIAFVSAIFVAPARLGRRRRMLLFAAIFAFAMLGFVTGQIMGDSRQSAVATVVPAVLTLLGGVAVYVVGSKGTEAQGAVSAMVFCFAFALLLGSLFGTRLRVEFESALVEPARLRQMELASEDNKIAIETQRLLNYIELLKLRRDFAEKTKLDLSKFNSGFEKQHSSADKSDRVSAETK